jgi:hypothetical protein
MNEPKKRVKNQEPEARKPEASSPKSEFENPMLRQAKHDKEDPETKELPTDNRPLQTEKMEVHHHPDIHHEKKAWKEYLLEGLMIFVAVMMGFFAESIRENITNGEHVKQLTIQLVQDLKSDTAALRQIDSAETRILAKTDTLSALLQQPVGKIDMKRVQLLITICYSQWPFYPSVGGMTAIKNELRLKQFSSSKINRYLTGYESRIAILHKIEDIHSRLITNYLESFFRLHFTPENLSAALERKPVVDAQMRDLTQYDLTQLATDLILIRNINSIMISYNRKLKTQAVETIVYVKKQYDLEDE